MWCSQSFEDVKRCLGWYHLLDVLDNWGESRVLDVNVKLHVFNFTFLYLPHL